MTKLHTYRFRAYHTPKGSTMRSGIIGVLATSEKDARQRITEELSKPGRHMYLQLWNDSGQIVVNVDEEETNGHAT